MYVHDMSHPIPARWIKFWVTPAATGILQAVSCLRDTVWLGALGGVYTLLSSPPRLSEGGGGSSPQVSARGPHVIVHCLCRVYSVELTCILDLICACVDSNSVRISFNSQRNNCPFEWIDVCFKLLHYSVSASDWRYGQHVLIDVLWLQSLPLSIPKSTFSHAHQQVVTGYTTAAREVFSLPSSLPSEGLSSSFVSWPVPRQVMAVYYVRQVTIATSRAL